MTKADQIAQRVVDTMHCAGWSASRIDDVAAHVQRWRPDPVTKEYNHNNYPPLSAPIELLCVVNAEMHK